MIVELVQREGSVLAVNNVGDLILWQATPRRLNSAYRFDHNISLVQSCASLKISKNQLVGLVTLQNTIVAFSRSSLLVADLSKIRQVMEEGIADAVKQIKLIYELEENEKINCLVAIDYQKLVFGTSHNNLYLYNFAKQIVELKKSLAQQKVQDVALFTGNASKISEITTIAVLKAQQLLLVGCDNGKILTVDAQRLQIVNQITQSIKTPLQKVNKLYLPTSQQKLFSIHQNYIIEWNYKLNLAHSCFEYANGTGIILSDETLYLGGSNNTLSRIKQQISQVELSTRCVGVMRELQNGAFAVGGADNLVDVFQDGMRLMTLFKK